MANQLDFVMQLSWLASQFRAAASWLTLFARVSHGIEILVRVNRLLQTLGLTLQKDKISQLLRQDISHFAAGVCLCNAQ